MRAVHAGDGYAYLLNSVASHDDPTSPNTQLHDYYLATGTPPGRWFGRGITGLGETSVEAGGVVEEFQMAALFGEGLHPDADTRVEAGESTTDTQLGRAYPSYTKGVDVLEAIKRAENTVRKNQRRRLTAEEKNVLGLEVARPFYEAQAGGQGSSPREVLAWLNEMKNSVRQPVAGMDLTFSPTKSVSILWALGDEETRAAIERIHHQAVADSLAWVEENLLFTRTGARGERQIRARGMMAATFLHYDTREGDPDLHTHCLIANKVQAHSDAGLDAQDAAKWRAVDTRFLFKNSARISQRYQRIMVHRLETELGLDFYARASDEDKEPVWEIAGITPELITRFSGRRTSARPVYEHYAAQYAETHGHTPSDRTRYRLWQQAILDTRDAKKPAQSLADHRTGWATQNGGQLLSAAQLAQPSGRDMFPAPGTDEHTQAVEMLARQAVEDTRQRRAHFAHRHLDTSLSMRMNQWTFTTEDDADATRNAAHAFALEHLIVAADDRPKEELPSALLRADGRVIDRDSESEILTARATLAEENTVLASLNQPTGYLATRREVSRALTSHATAKGFELNTGQTALVRHFTETGAKITAGVGPAGTGKTAAMSVVADIWRANNHQVVALAPSAVAAQNLGRDIDAEGHTLASLTYRWRGLTPQDARSVAALGVDIRPGDMLLLDETGMATTADLAALVEIAEATGAVVRMVGDPHQLDAVETGGLFRTIVKHDDSVELDQVMRVGSDTAQAQAGLAIRHGDPTGLDLYAERGWIHHGSRADMITEAAAAHLQDEAAGRSSILIASTREDVATANQIIQDARITGGNVQATGPTIQLGTGHQAHVGDTILTRRNQTVGGQRVLNGQRFTIQSIREDGSAMVVGDDRTRPLNLAADYLTTHVQLGYAATVHRAQGVTVDTTRAVVGPGTDRRGLYVALTRGKEQNHVYVAQESTIDLDSEDAHWHMAGENQPDDPLGILRHIITHDGGQRSATDLHRELATQATSNKRTRELLATATDLLAHDWRRSVVEPHVRTWLDRLPAADLKAIDEDQAVERIGTVAIKLAGHGVDYRDLLADATADLDGARDVGAVITHRLTQHLPEEKPALAHLPPVHAGADHELYDWAEATRTQLDTQRELRPLEAPLPDKGQVTGQDFSRVDFRGLELRGLQFIDCDLTEAVFDDTQLHRVSFTRCHMQDTTFTGAKFGVGDSPFHISPLTDCDLSGADFTGAQLVRSRFTNCQLVGADFTRAQVAGRFQHVDFTGADFTNTQIGSFIGVADSILDDQAPAALHQAQETTDTDRNRRRQERMTGESTEQDTSPVPTAHHQGLDLDHDGPEL